MIKLKILLFLCLVLQVSISKSQPSIPEALEAKNISRSSFIADWNAVDGVNLYSIDVSKKKDFSVYASGIVNGVEYDNLSNIYHIVAEPDSPSEIEIRDLELGVYYYRVRAIIVNDGSSDDSKTIRVSLFKESLDFSGKKPITNPSYVPHSLIIQDMDGDGDKDVISASRNYASLQDNRFNYHEQEGIKTLLFDSEGKSIKKNYRARRIIAYDILGDSNPEIISFPTRDGVGNSNNGGAFIFQKMGNTFNSMPIDNDNFFHTFSLYDINNDGEADIITANNSRLSFYLGEGNSMFSEESIITTIENNYNFGAYNFRDIDDDGDIDIVSYLYKDGDIPNADYIGDFFVIYENLGNNFFIERRVFTPIPGRSIINNKYSIADMNNDGKKDIVCITIKHFEGLDGSVYLYKQEDNLSFSDPIVVIEEGSSISGIFCYRYEQRR